MKKIIIAGMLFASSSAFAGLIHQEASFGTQGSHNDIALGTLGEVLSVNSFDTLLGTLTSVNVTVYGQMDSAGSSTNQSDADGRAEVGISLFQDWKVTTSAADDYTFQAASFTPYLSASSSPVGVYTLVTNTPQDTFSYDVSTGENSFALTGVNLASFTTGNPIDFNFSGFVQTTITNGVESGTGHFLNSFQTGSWGKVEVDYVYSTTEVSEPSSFAIAGFGLLLLGMRRLKR